MKSRLYFHFFRNFPFFKKNRVSLDVHPKQRSLELYSFFSQACNLDFTIALAVFLTLASQYRTKRKNDLKFLCDCN